MAENKPISIRIMGNEYHVASPEGEVAKLEEAARALDKRMREIKDGGRVMGLDKVAEIGRASCRERVLRLV